MKGMQGDEFTETAAPIMAKCSRLQFQANCYTFPFSQAVRSKMKDRRKTECSQLVIGKPAKSGNDNRCTRGLITIKH